MALGGMAKADDIHLCATAAACQGNASNVQLTGSTTGFVYGKASAGDTLYVVVLTPVANSSGNWSGGQLWTVAGINESPSQTYPQLSAAICNLEGGGSCGAVTGFSANSFNVADYSLGSYGGALDTNPLSFTLPGTPAGGDMYIAFLEDGSGNLVAVSPWSSSLLYTPEPGVLTLLLCGVIGMGLIFRRRLAHP